MKKIIIFSSLISVNIVIWYEIYGITWFPDSSAVAFVRYDKKNFIIKKFEIETGAISDLATGKDPRIAADGSVLAYWKYPCSSKYFELKILNLTNMVDVKVSIMPDFKKGIFDLVGMPDSSKILYVGWTTGLPEAYRSKVQWGAKSLKVGNPKEGTYETIYILEGETGYGGSRYQSSYGKITK